MSDDPTSDAQPGAAAGTTPDPPAQTFSADYVASLRREAAEWRTKAQTNAQAAQRLPELEQQMQTLTAERDANALAALRYEVAAEKQLPLAAVQNLTGADRDALVASADNLLSTINAMAAAQTPPAAPPPVPATPDPGNAAEAAQAFLGDIFN